MPLSGPVTKSLWQNALSVTWPIGPIVAGPRRASPFPRIRLSGRFLGEFAREVQIVYRSRVSGSGVGGSYQTLPGVRLCVSRLLSGGRVAESFLKVRKC